MLPYFLSPFLLSLFPVQELTDSDLIHYFCVETWVYKLFGFFVLPSSEDYEKTAMTIIGLMTEAPVMLCFQSNSQNAMLRSMLRLAGIKDELVFFSDLAFFFSLFSGQATWCVFSFRKSASHFPTTLSLHKIWHGISAE